MLPETRHFKLPEPLGWIANLIGIAWTILTTVLFVFPPALPVTGPSMNYCIVAFAVVVIISLIQWIVDGRKNYSGPRVDIDEGVLTAMESPSDVLHQDAAASGHGGAKKDLDEQS